jgi:hypothetical protein
MIDLCNLIAPILTHRAPDGQDISSQICFSSDFFISGAANPAETPGSSTFAGVHARSTFRMLHLWHREWTSPHDRDSNTKVDRDLNTRLDDELSRGCRGTARDLG